MRSVGTEVPSVAVVRGRRVRQHSSVVAQLCRTRQYLQRSIPVDWNTLKRLLHGSPSDTFGLSGEHGPSLGLCCDAAQSEQS